MQKPCEPQPEDDMDDPLSYIVCAAIRLDDIVVCGARHYDNVMRRNINRWPDTEHERQRWYSAEQGFIDNKGEFLNRAQAWKIAERAKQIRRSVGPDGVLYSENLY